MKRIGFIFSFLFLVAVALGQSAPPTQISASNDTGLSLYTAYSTGLGDVNLTNGNMTLEIPLIKLPGRAGNAMDVALQYDSKNWVPHYVISGDGSTIVYTWQIEKRDIQAGDMGWRFNVEEMIPGGWATDGNGNQTGYLPNIVMLKDGSKHSIGEIRFCCGTSLDAEDASALGVDTGSSDFLVRPKHGGALDFPALGGYSSDTDSNGNTYSDFVDTLGRTVTITNQGLLPHLVTFKDSSGTTQTITLNYSTLTLFSTDPNSPYYVPSPSFALPAQSHGFYWVWVNRPAPNSQYALLTSITLQDGTQYQFGYNGYGELTSVTLPIGGYAQYSYAAYTHLENYWWGPGYNMAADFREVTSRTVCNGAGLCGTTTYTPTISSIYVNNNRMDVVEASGTTLAHLTRHNFTQASIAGEVCDKFYSPREISSYAYAGSADSSQLLRTVVTNYNSYTGGACGDLYLPTTITTSLNDIGATPLVKQEQFDYDTYTAHVFYPFATDPCCQTAQDVAVPIDNAIAHREYDYGWGSRGPLIRTTTSDWLKTSTYTARNTHILGRKLNEKVYDGNGTLVASTLFEYDNYREGLWDYSVVQHVSVGVPRGNPTASAAWRNTDGAYLWTTREYETSGNLRKITDPRSHITTLDYGDRIGNAVCGSLQRAYLTAVTNHLGQQTLGTYNSCTGTVYSVTDPNSQMTRYLYDLMGRTTNVYYPDGGQTIHAYYAYPNFFQINTQRYVGGGNWTSKWTELDGLGRLRREASWNGQSYNMWDELVVCYDVVGRVSYKAYPFEDNGWVWSMNCDFAGDHFYYDSLNRPTQVQHSDGSTLDTTYLGRATSITDEGNGTTRLQRISQVDGLGRLRSVCEVSSTSLIGSGGSPVDCGQDIDRWGFLTTYDYDVLANLTAVHQSGLADRAFTYDSLSQLTYAWNPESGPAWYGYDDDGLMTARTRPLPNQGDVNTHVTTYYAYEPLHRLTSKTYTDNTRSVWLTYDETSRWRNSVPNGIGHQTSAWTSTWDGASIGEFVWGYDPMGRVQHVGMCTPRTCGWAGYDMYYNYNQLGQTISQFNAVGVWQYNNYDGAGRLRSVTSSLNDASHPGTLLDNIHYEAAGIGSLTMNNGRLSESRLYTARGWLQSVNVPGRYSFNLNFAPDGNVTSSSDSVNSNWNYIYDAFNRLSTAVASDGRGCSEVYDRFGNRWQQNNYNGSCPAPQYGFTGSNNRIDGRSYDAAGNLLNDGSHSYTYDAEGRITAVDSGNTARYDYDAFGQRARNSFNNFEFLYDLDGHAVTMLDKNSGGWQRGEVYAAGRHVATYANATTYLSHSDWLGTERLQTDINGNAYNNWLSYPFGESWSSAGVTDRHFTGKERDWESGLDYFGARYYASALGRFMSVDPQVTDLTRQIDPQQLNMYGYGRNNPLRYTDESGEEVKEAIHVVTYEVHGATANEALANARTTSGFKSETGEAMSGTTSATMQIVNTSVERSVTPGSPLVDSFATSEVKSADVKLDQTITLPSWAEQTKSSPEEQKAFTDAVSGLKEHEEGHAAINRQQAQKLDKSLPGTTGRGQGKTPQDALNKATKNMVQKENNKAQQNNAQTRTQQQEYDKKTDHGRKQHEPQ